MPGPALPASFGRVSSELTYAIAPLTYACLAESRGVRSYRAFLVFSTGPYGTAA